MGGGKKVTMGYKYFLGMHLAVCHGPVDEVQEILVGERVAWTGSATTNSSIFIDSPDLFGGEKKEGGVQGTVDIAMGGNTQTPNAYLQGQLGSDIPAFRGVLSLILNQVYVTAMTRFPKPWAVKVKRTPALGWYDAKAIIPGQGSPGDPDYIPGGSANGAHILYECLTNSDWGLGLTGALINAQAFKDAADILYDEQFGLSMILANQTTVESFITIVITHIGAVLYSDRTTGEFTLKLIRPPSQPEIDDALVFDESNILELASFERPSFAEMINEVVLRYRPQGATSDSSFTVQDLSSTQAQNGLISQTVDFPGIDNSTMGSRIAIRELKQYSTPLAKVRIIVNRDGWSINPGAIIKFQWGDLGIENIVMRVFSVNYGTLAEGKITIDCSEDIFSLPAASYLSNQGSEWVEPVRDPEPATSQALYELPYWHIANDFTQAGQDEVDNVSAYYQMLTQKDSSLASASYQAWTSETLTPDSAYAFDDDSVYTPLGLLTTDIDRVQTSIIIDNMSPDVRFVELGTYAYIGQEAVRVDAFNISTGVMTIARAALDTVPVVHFASDKLYFADEGFNVSETEYVISETLYVKPLVQTDIGILPIASATASSITFIGRQAKPYPAAQVKFNGIYFPEDLNANVGLPLTWKYQDRTLQTVTINSWYESNQGSPEEGVDYYIAFYNENDVLEFSTNFAGSAYTYTSANEKENSGLVTYVTDRVLVTSGLAVATTNVIYSSITDPTLGTGSGCVFRRMGADWVALSIDPSYVNAERYYIDGATGVLTKKGVTRASWITRLANITANPIGVRSDADFIAPELAGTQAGWAVLNSDTVAPLTSYVAVNFGLQDCVDHRAIADNSIALSTREDEVIFVANGFLNNKRIFFTRHDVHIITRVELQSATNNFPTTVTSIESFFAAEAAILNAANTTNQTYPALTGALSGFNVFAASPPWKSMAFGTILYITYRGRGASSFTTVGKALDVTNVLNAHLPTVYSDTSIRTDRFTIGASSVSLIDSFQGMIFADRSNVADTQGIQWKTTGSGGGVGSTFEIINSSTGAVTFTSAAIFGIAAMAVDWVNSFIYVVNFSTRAIHKIDYTGALISNIAFPTASAITGLNCNLSVSSDKVYLYDAPDARVYSIDKDLVGPWSLTALAAKKINNLSVGDWAAYARPDSSLIYNYDANIKHVLYDENGGQSPFTPTAEPRQNTTIRTTIRSDRGTIEGYQTFEHTLERSGYGYNYGNFYGE